MSRGGEGSKTTLLRVIRNEQNGGWLSRATETMMGNRDRFLREADSGGGWHPVAPVHSLFRQYIYFVDLSSSSSSSYKYIQRSCDDQNSSFMPMMLLQICTSVWNEASSVWNRNDR